MIMHEEKKKEFDIKIQNTELKLDKLKRQNKDNQERRNREMEEFKQKVEGASNDLKLLGKSKNLVSKNIKNADERIRYLIDAMDKLRVDKYKLMKDKNSLISQIQKYEEEISKYDPDFLQSLTCEESKTSQSQQNNLLNTQTTTNTRSAIEDTRSQMQQNLEDSPQNNGLDSEDEKIAFNDETDRRAKMNTDAKTSEELSVVQERESEYYGSNITSSNARRCMTRRFNKGTTSDSNYDSN